MNLWQKFYNWLKAVKTPIWWHEIGDVVDASVAAGLNEIGRQAYDLLKNKIIEVSTKNKTSKEKFSEVYDYARTIGISLRDSLLSVLINSLVLALKTKGAIK